MDKLLAPRHGPQVTKTFAQGSLVGVVVVIAAITAITLIYAWFFT